VDCVVDRYKNTIGITIEIKRIWIGAK
jgi:hypothetical protein